MDLTALFKLGYGLYIVTSRQGDRLNGQIANTVFQITSEPPTIAVSINKQNLTWEFIKESGVFAVSVLCQETPLAFMGRFGFKSGRAVNKLDGVNYKIGETKAPLVIENATAIFEAVVVNEMDMGTHTIFVGKTINAEVLSNNPCMTYEYYHQVKGGKTPKTAPSYIEEKKTATLKMDKYKCSMCGWVYDPEFGDQRGGIAPGTPFEKIPDGWQCPICGAMKSSFQKVDG